MSSDERIIAVFGATGAQGGGVVAHLRERGRFRARALTRAPQAYAGLADEVVAADLERPETLAEALRGAWGMFLVTNFGDRSGSGERAQAERAIEAARAAGVQHVVWSTLPDVARITDGRYHVPHFSQKAEIDTLVRDAGFRFTTFVQAPFYFQNFESVMAPRDLGDGRLGWALPLDPSARVVHMGDIRELGAVVAGALERPEAFGGGATLAMAAGRYSFDDVVRAWSAAGREVAFQRVPAEVFARFFPGADEMAQMMRYWEEHTYMGPDADARIARAREASTRPFTELAPWVRAHLEVA